MYNPYQQNYSSSDIRWCQGEAGAKSYPVAPGHTIDIFDSEESCLYIKSVDIMGRPLPLKILDYTERQLEKPIEHTVEEKNYVEIDLFDEVISSLEEKMDKVLDFMKDLTKPVEKEKKTNAK